MNNKKNIINNDIITFIEKESIDVIKNSIFETFKSTLLCNKILGSGYIGTVYTTKISEFMPVKTSSNKIIKLPVVIKNTNRHGPIGTIILEKKLYIYAHQNITLEAIILTYINKLWHKKLSPNLPFMIGSSCCDVDNPLSVSQIIREKHGLEQDIEIDINFFNEKPIWGAGKLHNDKWISSLNTLHELLGYINISKKINNNITLPNGITCDIIKLLDYICISYIHTHNLLCHHNIIPRDMHEGNIFIHWLNDNSYLDDINLKNIKYIYYKYKDKIIKIETFGFIIKIGDTGSFIVKPKKNIILIAHAYNIENNYKLIKQISKANYSLLTFFRIFDKIPKYIYKEIILNKIFKKYPYNSLTLYNNKDILQKLFKPTKILSFYKKYFVDNIDNENSLIVNEF
jgi:hypothetical protein